MGSIAPIRRLEGKVAIVTGGASGIGAAAVQLFHDHGAKVMIADIQDDPGQALADSLGPHAAYTHCDVSDEDQVAALVDATVAKFGCLDIMYSNAGILARGTQASISAEQGADLVKMLGINLVGGFLVAKHAARVMVPNKKGCIIFTSSACTEIAGIASHIYTASKYGVLGLTKSLAAELGEEGIRVNCVSPFGVLTGGAARAEVGKAVFGKIMGAAGTLKGRLLGVEDVANAALYLASDEAGYVSGMNLMVDGAYSVVNPTLSNVVASFM